MLGILGEECVSLKNGDIYKRNSMTHVEQGNICKKPQVDHMMG